MSKVLSFLNKYAIVRGGLFFLSQKDAIEFINICRLENKKLLGIDGFIIEHDKTIPSMENSVDFTYLLFDWLKEWNFFI